MPTSIEALAELREQTDVLLQQTTAAQARLRPVEARDGSGQVNVRLDASGRLERVQVGFAWEQTLGPDALPTAVLEALAHAREARFEQYGAAVTEVVDEPPPRARPAAGSPVVSRLQETLAARANDPKAAGELLTELLDDADVALSEANRLLDEHAGRKFAARSGSGHVLATVSGNGEVEALEIDQRWVGRGAHPANVGREITQAVLSAGAKAQREGLAAALQASKLAQLARLLTDPVTDQFTEQFTAQFTEQAADPDKETPIR